MNITVDTSVLVDVLRGELAALAALRAARSRGPLHGSELTRLEVLAGTRARDERRTRTLLETISWHPVDERTVELASNLGRRWLPTTRGIDTVDLVIAATTMVLEADLLTTSVRRFPMFEGLASAY